MILDGNLIFDGTYSVTTGLAGVNVFTSGSSQVSTNILDLLNQRDIGRGRSGMPLNIVVIITTAFTGGTSLNIQFQGSTDNVTWTTYAESGALPVAVLTLGAQLFSVSIPAVDPTSGARPRYLRLNYVCAGAMTTGAVISMIGADDSLSSIAYTPGFTVAN